MKTTFRSDRSSLSLQSNINDKVVFFLYVHLSIPVKRSDKQQHGIQSPTLSVSRLRHTASRNQTLPDSSISPALLTCSGHLAILLCANTLRRLEYGIGRFLLCVTVGARHNVIDTSKLSRQAIYRQASTRVPIDAHVGMDIRIEYRLSAVVSFTAIPLGHIGVC